MGHPLSLRLYLAAGARAERAQRRTLAIDRHDLPEQDPAPQDLCRERLGEATRPRPDGPLLWIHSGQDRDALAARELTQRLRTERPDLQFLFTTSGPDRLPAVPQGAVQMAPVESLPAIRRFLDHWRPSLALWTEADLRPALTAETAARGIPQFLVDARTAPPAWLGFRPWPRPASSLLAPFRTILTGDKSIATALTRLGARPACIETPGFLEEGTGALACNAAERDNLGGVIAGRPVWLAARCADAELEAILDAHRAVLRRSHRLLLILCPAAADTGPALLDRIRAQDFTVCLRSDGAEPEPDTQIYIADTEDEMGLWYRLAAISFLGQTLASGGGINPFEAAALGSAILHGPNVRNFEQAYARLDKVGATRMVRNSDQMATALEELLAPDLTATMAHAAWQVCSSGAEVTDRAIDLILAELDRDPSA